MIRTLLAEDSEVMRKAIVNLLKSDPEIQLLGEAASFKEAIRLANTLRPQVIILDLHMSDDTEVIPSEVKASFQYTSIVAMSLANDAETKAIAKSFGAVTLIDKMTLSEDLIPTIKQHASAHWRFS